MKIRKSVWLFIILTIISLAFLWSSGLVGIWTHGISYISQHTSQYTMNGHSIDDDYEISIDLTDLDANLGKELYNDGEHRIYVFWLQKTNNGGYDIGFRSSGKYSLSGASLVSGVHHQRVEGGFTSLETAKMTYTYDNRQLDAYRTGHCGINYKDGDCFSFSFLTENDVPSSELKMPATLVLTVTDLYKNRWQKS
ncbi:hypothetical protein [Paenibacillus daejeonensis]|uniref:hypothetical protein n=1 Tax=Paenibacillus daejeonensis TaxID=135193 RepID=UPI00037F5484|nr:hypothetical protein [Paenibacillus daejeonensis]